MATTKETTTKQYRLTIGYDHDTENPISPQGLFTLHMFSSRMGNFTNPDALLGCRFESDDEDSDEFYGCGRLPFHHEDAGHEYDGPVGIFVSYFEHGLCRYGVAGTMNGMPDFRWDGVEYAGFLEVNENELEWWNGKTEAEREEIAATTLEEYTDWANGNCYWYSIDSFEISVCDQGEEHEVNEEYVDSCGGFIGDKWFAEALRDAMPEDMTEDNTTITDHTAGMAGYLDLFRRTGK